MKFITNPNPFQNLKQVKYLIELFIDMYFVYTNMAVSCTRYVQRNFIMIG